MLQVPVVDFSKCSLQYDRNAIDEDSFKEIGHHLHEACKTAGFAYLSNTGLPRSKADTVNEAASRFFSRPLEYKTRFCSANSRTSAYTRLGDMTLNAERPFDHQEGFRVTMKNEDAPWPDIPGLKESTTELSQLCKKLLLRVLSALGYGMNLKDPQILADSHKLLTCEGNISQLKLIHYPGIAGDVVLEEGQLRISEHTDFGSLTLLFQDDVGGLQVQGPDGKFVGVPHIPETILLNVGDMMQFWTSGRLKSTVHRVVIPEDPVRASRVRRSITYFANADDDVLLTKLPTKDSVQEEAPKECLTSKEYFLRRFQKSYA